MTVHRQTTGPSTHTTVILPLTPAPEAAVTKDQLVMLMRADRLEEQAAAAWHDGNPKVAGGLLRLARQFRQQAREAL